MKAKQSKQSPERARPSRALPMEDRTALKIESALATDRGPYAQWVRPQIDRAGLLRAVTYNESNQALLRQNFDKLNAEQRKRYETLFLIRAIHRELREWAKELKGSLASPGLRSALVTKAQIFEAVAKRRPLPKDNPSRWFEDNVLSTCDPDPHDPKSRTKLTLNMHLFKSTFGAAAANRLRKFAV